MGVGEETIDGMKRLTEWCKCGLGGSKRDGVSKGTAMIAMTTAMECVL